MGLAKKTQHLLTAAFYTIIAFSPQTGMASSEDGPVVLVQQVKAESIFPSFQHPAKLEAINTASVRPLISAQITEIHINAGEHVKAGDLLIELDKTDYKIALAEAEANLLQAQANSVKAVADFERAERLVSLETISERDLDFALANKNVAEAQVKIAEARLQRARKNLDDTVVKAPFDGRISAAKYAKGDLFQPGDPTQPGAVAELVSLDPIYATGLVDQANYFQFLARRLNLENAGVSIPPLEIELVLPGGTTYPLTGVFENWDNTAIASTGTIAGRVIFENPKGVLLPGENVTVRGSLIEAVDAMLVPQKAISFDQQGYYVWVVGADNTVSRQNIEIGIRDGGDWTVPVGLEEGQTVVVEGLQKVREGATVTPKPYQE
ncbi:efflux RND transporter periplasmic adaptor subunit [Shimia haliotis]|uniref:Membrane fusion protein, multidrug efflux system n=1 Tax=Shimia haliotis TaxID=1280847 RepID=A0A1I4GWU5_9RHOB|nr:efflux RND transporter periplasmic adaptor subunit [Shimia haliotis]SFL33606.1 membrane fusion protein, multidrug efflux system [Shimia haliotis]